jgi:hypothetical protein
LPFNTNGMYRGYVDPDGKFVVEIYHQGRDSLKR